MKAHNLPISAGTLEEIREEAVQAFFKSVCDRFALLGFPLWGDIAPWEVDQIAVVSEDWVRMIALNNNDIAKLNENAQA